MRVGLIACSKQKLNHAAPAQDLYVGPLFTLCKKWITKKAPTGVLARCDDWAILSAKHGVVLPDQVIEPYDVALSSYTRDQKKVWDALVYEHLSTRWGTGAIYTVLAGYDYRSAVKQMPMVEDVIECWTQWRVDAGMTRRRAAIGIGVLKKYLKEDKPYY